MAKKDAKSRLIRWVLLLDEFDFKVKDRKDIENQVANHLTRLEEEAIRKVSKRLEIEDNGIIRKCKPEMEMMSILEVCHSYPVGGHHIGARIAHKILQCGYYWQTIYKDSHDYAAACDQCQRQGLK
ncbi:uncharacterized protein LOC124888896 [Capsicum annuum]|uniref:uncharacterized protein LOC124888896 n=1 Tax=Capsicum annuum TaxID=4072 RepID=UPI001FB06531|nr:uncharacterized protein LOC124888896 [Capsicum annuum]